MAARLYPAPERHQEIVDLRRLAARDLDALLEEECQAWRDELEWGFEKSADPVRRFVDMNALGGRALLEDGRVAGYMYYVLEDDKGLIGDLYVCKELRTVERENLLLASALQGMMDFPAVARIEAHLLMLRYDPMRPVPRAACLRVFERNFMRIDLKRAVLGRGNVRRPMYVEKWSDHYHDAAAQLIAAAY